jgi:hypothetical protein
MRLTTHELSLRVVGEETLKCGCVLIGDGVSSFAMLAMRSGSSTLALASRNVDHVLWCANGANSPDQM